MTKIITIAQQKGGAGKSTIAAHIAVGLSQRGSKVLIIDTDPQGSLKNWHKIREDNFGKGYAGIHISDTSGWKVTSSITKYKNRVDFIIIDSPPHTEIEAKNAIRSADLVLIPLQASPTDLWATQSTIDCAKHEKKQYNIILNRYNPNSKTSKEISGTIDNVMHATLGNRIAFSNCFFQGKTVTETEPSSVASNEVKALIEEILSALEIKDEI
jgi:chromosome partitioning protein